MILDCLLREEVLKLSQLCGILRGQIVGLAEVLGYMVEFPSILGERRKGDHQPRDGMTSTRHPAVVIDAAITKHFEILSRVRLPCLRIVERINHRGPIKRPLRCSVYVLGERQAGGLQYSRRNVRDMSELGADFSLGFNSRWPMYNYTVRGSAVMRRDLLGPLERSVASPRPANCIMRERARVAPILQVRHIDLGGVNDSIQRHHLVIGAFRSTFCAGSVVAHNVNEQGVVQYAHLLKSIHQSSYLFVGVLGKTGESFHLRAS